MVCILLKWPEVVYHVLDVIISFELIMVYRLVQCAARLACKLHGFECNMYIEYS